MNAVASGCVAGAIEADEFAVQFYSSGIIDGRCGTSIDHGVVIVGYGSENEQEYWKDANNLNEDSNRCCAASGGVPRDQQRQCHR